MRRGTTSDATIATLGWRSERDSMQRKQNTVAIIASKMELRPGARGAERSEASVRSGSFAELNDGQELAPSDVAHPELERAACGGSRILSRRSLKEIRKFRLR